MEVLYERCCGLDVPKKSVATCLLIAQPLSHTAIPGEHSNNVQVPLQKRVEQDVPRHPELQ